MRDSQEEFSLFWLSSFYRWCIAADDDQSEWDSGPFFRLLTLLLLYRFWTGLVLYARRNKREKNSEKQGVAREKRLYRKKNLVSHSSYLHIIIFSHPTFFFIFQKKNCFFFQRNLLRERRWESACPPIRGSVPTDNVHHIRQYFNPSLVHWTTYQPYRSRTFDTVAIEGGACQPHKNTQKRTL